MSAIKELFSSSASSQMNTTEMMPVKKQRATGQRMKPICMLSSSSIDADAINTLEPIAKVQKRQTKGKTQQGDVIQFPHANSLNLIADHDGYVTHSQDVSISDDTSHAPVVIHREDAGVIGRIIYLWRMRQRWHRAEKSLILQGKALCRSLVDGDKDIANKMFDDAVAGKEIDEATMLALIPFLLSVEHFNAAREEREKELAKLAKKLPAYKWIESVNGIAAGGYASLIGEAGDIRDFKSVAALWKRMGLAVIEGGRQRRVTNADDALVHGYSPSRRSTMWNIGNGLIGGMGRGKRPAPGADLSDYDWTDYQKLFVERCRYECANNPEKMALATVEKDGELRESYPKHAQSRAKRYVEKRFLRDLYAQWKSA